MEVVKKLIFFLLMPVYLPLALLVNTTYEWWASLSGKNKILFFVLMPFYGPVSLFLLWSFDWWVSLSE